MVRTDRINAVAAPRFNDDVENLRAYVDAIEKGPDSPPGVTRIGTDAMTIRAKLEAGQSIVVQQSYDPAWEARSGGQQLRVHKDAMGMTVIDAPPGEGEIRLEFVSPLENHVGRVVALVAFLAVAGLLGFEARARSWWNRV